MRLFGGPRYPEEVAKRVPPGNRLVKGWPVLHYGPVPKFDEAAWNLEVFGLVENPFTLSYSELRALGPAKVDADMHCVTGWTTLDNEWEGVPFRAILERAKPKPEAKWVIAHCEYGYTSNLSLQAMEDDDVLLAWANKGEFIAWLLRVEPAAEFYFAAGDDRTDETGHEMLQSVVHRPRDLIQ